MPTALLYTGNSLDILKELADESVQMCVTSPPYWGLRDYTICQCRQGRVQHESSTLVGSQAGTPSEFSAADSECEKCHGTGHIDGLYYAWCGDSTCLHIWGEDLPAHHPGQVEQSKYKSAIASRGQTSTSGKYCENCGAWYGSLGNEPTPELFIEHLVLVFREVRRVLRKEGTLWVNIGDSYAAGKMNRSDHGGGDPTCKLGPNRDSIKGGVPPGPVSQRKPPAGFKAKDLVGIPWMLAFALRADGWYLRQDIIWSKQNPMPESVTDRCVKGHEYVFLLSKSKSYYFDHIAIRESVASDSLARNTRHKTKRNDPDRNDGGSFVGTSSDKRNKRSVWTMSSQPFKGAH